MAKVKMTSQIRSDTAPVTMMSAMKSMSMGPANVDALSGQSGNSLNIAAAPLLTDHHDDEARQRNDRGDAAGADEVHRAAAVTAGRRIVVVTEEEDLIGRRADRSARRFDDTQPKVARLEFEAEEVPGDAAGRRQNEERRAVRELIAAPVVRVLETDGLGDTVNRRLVRGEEVPSVRSAQTSVAPDVLVLEPCRFLRFV